jgi:hypothetical protein
MNNKETMELVLFTMPHCRACSALKNILDKLQYSIDFETPFVYRIISLEMRDDLVARFPVGGVPMLFNPQLKCLTSCQSIDKVSTWIEESYRDCVEYDEWDTDIQ